MDSAASLMEVTDYGAEHHLIGHTFLARADGKPAGGIVLRIEGLHGDLELLFVSPELHSRGIGLAAWRAVEKLHSLQKKRRPAASFFPYALCPPQQIPNDFAGKDIACNRRNKGDGARKASAPCFLRRLFRLYRHLLRIDDF